MDILEKIITARKELLAEEFLFYENVSRTAPQRDFKACITAKKPSIIAEVKYASPAKGSFHIPYKPHELAHMYEEGGASAISVLACKPFFNGSPLYVQLVKKHIGLPVLWKDFIIDERQLEQAFRLGADAVLLISAVLGESIGDFVRASQKIGLCAVVEINTSEEAQIACTLGADIIVINNRNLKTMAVDIMTTVELAKILPKDTVIISASGIKSAAEISFLISSGVNAFLIGESAATAKDPKEAVRAFVRG